MTKDGVLVDTSVLIDFFKGKEPSATELTELLQKNRAIITGIVIAELMQGLKKMNEELSFADLSVAASQLELTTDIWIKTGRRALSLRKKGISLPLTDIAIATLAIEHNLSVFTLDKHFDQIPDIKLYRH